MRGLDRNRQLCGKQCQFRDQLPGVLVGPRNGRLAGVPERPGALKEVDGFMNSVNDLRFAQVAPSQGSVPGAGPARSVKPLAVSSGQTLARRCVNYKQDPIDTSTAGGLTLRDRTIPPNIRWAVLFAVVSPPLVSGIGAGSSWWRSV